MSDGIRLISTKDGSQSLFIPELNETYHSTYGAAEESQYVFIDYGLAQVDKSKIDAFEVGFGTGLNALLGWKYARENKKKLRFQAIENNPLPGELTSQYSRSWLDETGLSEDYRRLCEAKWEETIEIDSFFRLSKIVDNWLTFKTENKFDIIFYDAFAPSKQSEMWHLSLLEKGFDMLRDKGLLVTYCAQGQFRRDLQSAGFEVERLPGPPGKREMIRARKNL